jgi:hypothetical protein
MEVTFRVRKRCLSEFYHQFFSWLAFRVPNFLAETFDRHAEKPMSGVWKRGMIIEIRVPILAWTALKWMASMGMAVKPADRPGFPESRRSDSP